MKVVDKHEEEVKVEESKAEEAEKEEKNEKKSKKIEKLLNEIEKLKSDCANWKNEYYRAYADMKNLRDSLQKDHSQAMKYRAEGFIEGLLPVLDSFHMALSNEVKDEAVKNYLVGFQFIYKNLVSALENEGVTEISPKINDKFDTNVMQAVDTVNNTDVDDNVITKVYSKGYKLHDRLIRPVMVQVNKKEIKQDNKQEKNLDA